MTDIYTISAATWREPQLISQSVYLEDLTEDALDRECISLDEVEDLISAEIWFQEGDDPEEPRYEWALGLEEVPIGNRNTRPGRASEQLDLRREGSVVTEYYAVRL